MSSGAGGGLVFVFGDFAGGSVQGAAPADGSLLVSSSAVRTEGSSLGLPDRAPAADQSSVRPPGHAGRALDGETWL